MSGFNIDTPQLINACGASWFYSSMKQFIQGIYLHNYCFTIGCKRGEAPLILEADFQGLPMAGCLNDYLSFGCRADPVARLAKIGRLPAKVSKMRELTDLASDNCPIDYSSIDGILQVETEEAGFLTPGWPEGQTEVVISVSLGENTQIAISLFSDSQKPLRRLSNEYPLISALLRKHHEFSQQKLFEGSSEEMPVMVPHSRLVKSFFHSVMNCNITQRESEVFSRLLIGHSPRQISLALGVSEHTVTTHRRNVYRRVPHVSLLQLIRRFNEFSVRKI